MEAGCLLPLSWELAQLTYTLGPPWPGITLPAETLALPHQSLINKNVHTVLPTGQSDGGSSSVEIPAFPDMSRFISSWPDLPALIFTAVSTVLSHWKFWVKKKKIRFSFQSFQKFQGLDSSSLWDMSNDKGEFDIDVVLYLRLTSGYIMPHV